MEIKLDIHALNALFPEGTEARLKLQQCVLEEFSKRHIKALESTIRNQATAIHNSASLKVEEMFKESGWTKVYGNWKMPQSLLEELANTAKNLVTTESTTQMREAAHNAATDVLARMDSTVQARIERLVDERIKGLLATESDALLKRALRTKMQEILDNGSWK
jgi:hypothetical protein